MRSRIVRIVWMKELVDAVRDPRAVLYLIGLPLIFYPALLLALEYVAGSLVGEPPTPPFVVAIDVASPAPALRAAIDADEAFVVRTTEDAVLDVIRGDAQISIEPLPGFGTALTEGRPARLNLYFDRSQRGVVAIRARLAARLAAYEAQYATGRDPGHLVVVETGLKESLGDIQFMVGLFPYFLLVLVLVGAAHMAIDVTAGEKERRTLETLLVTAAGRFEILLGKALATMTASVTAGILGMIGFRLAIALAQPMTGGDPLLLALPGRAFWVLGLGSLPSALFLSALLLLLGAFARSSREGQTYSAYLQMPIMLLALGSTWLGLDRAAFVYAIPLLGANLMQREYLLGSGSIVHAAIATGSTIVLGLVLIAVSARLFRQETVLFRR